MNKEKYLEEKLQELTEYKRLFHMRENLLEQGREGYISDVVFKHAWNTLEDEIKNHLIVKKEYDSEVNLNMLLSIVIQKVSTEINEILSGDDPDSGGMEGRSYKHERQYEQSGGKEEEYKNEEKKKTGHSSEVDFEDDYYSTRFGKNEEEYIRKKEELEKKKKENLEKIKKFREKQKEYSKSHGKGGYSMGN